MKDKINSNPPQKQTNQVNKDFVELFGPFIPTIDRLQLLGHLGSGLLQFFVLRQIIQSHLNNFQQTGLVTLSIIFAVLFSIFIESGFITTVKVTSRQVTEKKFNGKSYWILFFMFGMAAIGFMYYSPWLSANGGKIAGNNIVTEYNIKDDAPITLQRDEEINTRSSIYNNAITGIKNKYASKIRREESKLLKEVLKWDAYWNKHNALVINGHEWAGSHKKKAVTNKKSAKAKSRIKVQELKVERDNLIALQTDEKSKALIAVTSTFDDKINSHNNREQGIKSRIDDTRDIISSLGFMAGFIFVGIAFICIVIKEVYYSKAKVSRNERHNWNRLFNKIDNLWQVHFWEMLLDRDLDGDGHIGNTDSPTPHKYPSAPNLSPVRNDNNFSARDIKAAVALATKQRIDEELKRVEDYHKKRNPQTPSPANADNKPQPVSTPVQKPANVITPVITEEANENTTDNDAAKKTIRYAIGDIPREGLRTRSKKTELTKDKRVGGAIPWVTIQGEEKTYRDIKLSFGNYFNKLGKNTISQNTFRDNVSKWLSGSKDLITKYPNVHKEDLSTCYLNWIDNTITKRKLFVTNNPNTPEKTNLEDEIYFAKNEWNKFFAPQNYVK